MLKKKEITGYLIFILIVIGLIFLSNYSSRKNCLKNVKNLNFNGTIVRKYFDESEHNYAIIEIITIENSIQKINLTNDHSGLFDYVQEKDSIIKQKGDLEVQVYHNLRDTIFILKKKCL